MDFTEGPSEPRAALRGRREIQAEDFTRLLARLDPDPARASEAYEKLREELVRFFNRNQSHLEAEELADRALDAIARKPDSYEIRNVHQFAIGVARYLQMEKSRRNAAGIHIANDENLLVPEQNPEVEALQRIDQARRVACFVRCMEALKPEERWLVMEYYPTDGRDLEVRRRRLALLLGIDAGALTSRINRLRAKLTKCCGNCCKQQAKKS